MTDPDKPDIGKLFEKAQELLPQVQQAQAALAQQTFQASSGGGVVTATVKGDGTVVSVAIDPEVLDPEDPELVGDLVVAAVNQALQAAQQASIQAVGGASGMDLGDLLGG